MSSQQQKVLMINSSARGEASTTRRLARQVLEQLREQSGPLQVTERDLAEGLPLINAHWVGANFTAPDKRNEQQWQALALSDSLIDEIETHDILVIAAPMYNFSVPASFKLWIDLIARVGRTFRYTDKGPVGLLEGKRAYVVLATGGVWIGSESDYASGYLKHILGFIGIRDVYMITAQAYDANDEGMRTAMSQQIEDTLKNSLPMSQSIGQEVLG